MILSHRQRFKVNPGYGSSDNGNNDSLDNVDAEVADIDSSGTDNDTIVMERQSGKINKVVNLPEKLGKLLQDCNFYW